MANNQAVQGGASAITESTVILYGITAIINNTATRGGAWRTLSLQQSADLPK